MNRSLGIKQCRICGGKANSFNFNGLACESCKTFFRRNAFKPDTFKCHSERKCEITVDNRKFCKKCRLDRCYEIGMKKELIWRSQYEQQNLETEIPNSVLHSPKNESINLNFYEQKMLLELNNASNIFPEETTLPVVGVAQNLLEVLSLPKFYIKKFIQYCKYFNAFSCLNAEDQLCLLKSAYVPILNIRFAFVYNPVTNQFPVMASETGQIAVRCDNAVLYEWNKKDMPIRFTKFQVTLNVAMENDATLRNLICIGYLFNRNCESIQNPEFILYQHFAYSRLFLRYLEHKYQDAVKASEKYHSLMEMLKAMQYQVDTIEELFVDLGLAKEDPVHKELFDLY